MRKFLGWFYHHPLLALALSYRLRHVCKQLRDSHLRWFITSVDGYPFFLFFYKGHFNLVKVSLAKNGDALSYRKMRKFLGWFYHQPSTLTLALVFVEEMF